MPHTARHLDSYSQKLLTLPFCAIPYNSTAGTGILTRCPSPTAFALGLGPTNPGMTNIAQETLLFRRRGFSPLLWLLIPAFSLLHAPPNFTVRLHGCEGRSSTPRAARKFQDTSSKIQTNFKHKIPNVLNLENWNLVIVWKLLLGNWKFCATRSRSFGTRLKPRYIFRAHSHQPVSCYALFECMAASKPTSWLST